MFCFEIRHETITIKWPKKKELHSISSDTKKITKMNIFAAILRWSTLAFDSLKCKYQSWLLFFTVLKVHQGM